MPIRVAQVVGRMMGGGVEATVMNHYRHIDRSQVQFDFIVQTDSTVVPKDEIESLGRSSVLRSSIQQPSQVCERLPATVPADPPAHRALPYERGQRVHAHGRETGWSPGADRAQP